MKISFIGSGNVATHLATEFYSKSIKIVDIYSRNISNARLLAERVNASFTDNLNYMKEADIFIISVSDDIIPFISSKIPFSGKLVAHTSGCVDISSIDDNNRRAVFYPLSTFSKNKKEIDFSDIPICLECDRDEDMIILKSLARKISNNIHELSSIQRSILHLSAVFVSNFTNYLYSIGEDLCLKNNINFNLLKPLISETTKKILTQSPRISQTGPAIRKDLNTITKHLNLLKGYQKEIYSLITNSIINNEDNNH